MLSVSDFPIRMSATVDGDSLLIKALLTHPMETGQAESEDGERLPAHYLVEVELLHNGVPVARVFTRTGVSPDPLFGWRLAGARRGDKIGLFWRDNWNMTGSFETTAQ